MSQKRAIIQCFILSSISLLFCACSSVTTETIPPKISKSQALAIATNEMANHFKCPVFNVIGASYYDDSSQAYWFVLIGLTNAIPDSYIRMKIGVRDGRVFE